MEAKDYASANNRAYYAIFHAMRAVLALDGEDFKKHSAVIARFTLNYLKPEILPREYSKLISNASLIRNRSDYEDFYMCSVVDTNALFSGAVTFCRDIGEFRAAVSYRIVDLQFDPHAENADGINGQKSAKDHIPL